MLWYNFNDRPIIVCISISLCTWNSEPSCAWDPPSYTTQKQIQKNPDKSKYIFLSLSKIVIYAKVLASFFFFLFVRLSVQEEVTLDSTRRRDIPFLFIHLFSYTSLVFHCAWELRDTVNLLKILYFNHELV